MIKKISYYIFFSAGWILLIISIIMFFSIKSELNLEFSLHYRYIKDFFFYFESPLIILSSSIILFLLGTTILRAYQFDKKLEISEQNNKFNNFFKHREEFKTRFYSDDFIKKISRIKDNKIEDILMKIYNNFYYQNYRDFRPEVNNDIKFEIDSFLGKIENSPLNIKNHDITGVDKNILEEISFLNLKLITGYIVPINKSNYQNIRAKLQESNLSNEEVTREISKYFYLNEFYISVQFYNRIFLFDGSKNSKCENFLNNITDYKYDLEPDNKDLI